jgi:hypothetical protein
VTPGKISGYLQFSFSFSPSLLIRAFYLVDVILWDESCQIRFDHCLFSFPVVRRRLIFLLSNGPGFEKLDPRFEKERVRALPAKGFSLSLPQRNQFRQLIDTSRVIGLGERQEFPRRWADRPSQRSRDVGLPFGILYPASLAFSLFWDN